MKKTFYETAGIILLAFAIFVAGFLFACFVKSPPMKETDAGTWAGALGAFLAFGGAIWLGTSEKRRREKEDEVRGLLAYAGLHARITIAHLKLKEAEEFIAQVLQRDIRDLSKLARILNGATFWTVEELVPLAVFGHECADHLARTPGDYVAIQEALRRAGNDSSKVGDPDEFFILMKTVMRDTNENLERAILILKFAAGELDEALGIDNSKKLTSPLFHALRCKLIETLRP